MNLIAVGVVLLVVDLASAYVNPEVYKRLLLREGVPEKMIPHREIEQVFPSRFNTATSFRHIRQQIKLNVSNLCW